MEDLGFSYIEQHSAWLHTPTSSIIFLHELFTSTDDEIHELVFERTGDGFGIQTLQLNPSEWLIEALKYPFDPPI